MQTLIMHSSFFICVTFSPFTWWIIPVLNFTCSSPPPHLPYNLFTCKCSEAEPYAVICFLLATIVIRYQLWKMLSNNSNNYFLVCTDGMEVGGRNAVPSYISVLCLSKIFLKLLMVYTVRITGYSNFQWHSEPVLWPVLRFVEYKNM